MDSGAIHAKAEKLAVIVVAFAIVVFICGLGQSAQAGSEKGGPPIKVGVVSILEGPFAGLGAQGLWGVKTALVQAGGKLKGQRAFDTVSGATAGGRKIQLFIESSDGSPDKALAATRKLVEQRKVDIFIGPLSGGEGLAIKEYAKKHTNVTFISGAASSQDLTLRSPARNYYRYSPDAVQMSARLGSYAYSKIGLKRVATIGEDYAFPYDQVGAFVVDFCRAGGDIVQRTWVPIGTTDYSSYIARIPSNADGILVILSGTDAVNFIKALDQFGRQDLKVIGGAVTVDPLMIQSLGSRAEGIFAGTAVANLNTPQYKAYSKRLKTSFPSSPGPGLNDVFYYTATESMIKALNNVHGDLSKKQANLRKALSRLRWTTPVGPVRLDANRQAIATTYITRVVNGVNRVAQVNKNVNQTLGIPRAQYLKIGPFSRTNPPCTK